ncbi:hypothetical protein JHK82_024343 [Glycine max]|nr:hypothetical protein JHK85_024927 [Glycine max]KAG5012174.1 hypothetical protein JHK86_024435 [Glycine max]KAG5133155.1 hypothetical protein JHK82_024343 [Glycine max]
MEGKSLFIEFPYLIKQKVADCNQAHAARFLTDPPHTQSACLRIQWMRNKELKEWPGMDLLRTCHHIFLDWCFIRELLKVLECPKLKILQLNIQVRKFFWICHCLTSLEKLYMGNYNAQEEIKGRKSQNIDSCLSELRNLNNLTTLNVQIEDTSDFPRDYLAFGRLECFKILIGEGWK